MVVRNKRRSLTIGDKVLGGKYTITKIIHTSGMANVYLVDDDTLGKCWCLKEALKTDDPKGKLEYESLIYEANIMKSLNHISIPRIVTIQEEATSTFILMDYVEGMSIKGWLREKGVISQSLTVKWARQICSVLIYLHNREPSIFYRDMKPDNVMIHEDGNIRLLDFGVSLELTEDNKIIDKPLGTRGYAAPEQSKRGLPCDLRSDIFALGRTLYFMVTGVNPSVALAGNPNAKLEPVRKVNSSISQGLEYIIDKCMKEDVEERYQTVEELLYDLNNYEKLDDGYKKKIGKKIYINVSMFAVSIALIVSGVLTLGVWNNKMNEKYNRYISTADTSGSYEDYLKALNIKSTDISAYSGFLRSIKKDGVFTKEEENVLSEYLYLSEKTLDKSPDFGELAFNIGELYRCYYYDVESGNKLSYEWYAKAWKKGYKEEYSRPLADLGSFDSNIESARVSSIDYKWYREYLNNSATIINSNLSTLYKIDAYLGFAYSVKNYADGYKKDGFSYDDVSTLLDAGVAYMKSGEEFSDIEKARIGLYMGVLGESREALNKAYGRG